MSALERSEAEELTLNGKIAVGGLMPGDILTDLKRLGFTDYEGRVYVQLLRQSPATAYEVSKSSGVPRPNTYNALETLAQRGAVLAVSEAPTRFVAAPAEKLLESIARQTSKLCSSVAARLEALAMPVDDQHVWTLSGNEAVHDKVDALIHSSAEMLMIKAADDILHQHIPALRMAGERGVEMLIVLFGFNTDEFKFGDRCRVYAHEANGVRMGSTDNLFTIAADHIEMVTATVAEEAVAAVHTRNQPIVNMAESLIRHDYYMAEIFTRFGPEIDAVFGPHLRDLRLACFTEEQAESFTRRTGLASTSATRSPLAS